MTPLLTFVIPVRHPANARDWGQQIANLRQTIASVAAQDDPGWRAIVVANTGADLPLMPTGFEVERVDFAPNPMHDRGDLPPDAIFDAFRLDKGRRALAGALRTRRSRYIMIMDDDDFVSRKLAGFVRAHDGANGWAFRGGYVWSDGGRLIYCHPAFSDLCGTSHIVRTDLYALPASLADADIGMVKQVLGSHRFIVPRLAAAGTPLSPLPFPGAIYRIGHSGSHSRSSKILSQFVFNRQVLRRPLASLRNLTRVRVLTSALQEEFFGSPTAAAAPALSMVNRMANGSVA